MSAVASLVNGEIVAAPDDPESDTSANILSGTAEDVRGLENYTQAEMVPISPSEANPILLQDPPNDLEQSTQPNLMPQAVSTHSPTSSQDATCLSSVERSSRSSSPLSSPPTSIGSPYIREASLPTKEEAEDFSLQEPLTNGLINTARSTSPSKDPFATLKNSSRSLDLACIFCTRRKVKCNKLNPCSTCTRAHVECVPRNTRKPLPTQTVSTSLSQAQPDTIKVATLPPARSESVITADDFVRRSFRRTSRVQRYAESSQQHLEEMSQDQEPERAVVKVESLAQEDLGLSNLAKPKTNSRKRMAPNPKTNAPKRQRLAKVQAVYQEIKPVKLNFQTQPRALVTAFEDSAAQILEQRRWDGTSLDEQLDHEEWEKSGPNSVDEANECDHAQSDTLEQPAYPGLEIPSLIVKLKVRNSPVHLQQPQLVPIVGPPIDAELLRLSKDTMKKTRIDSKPAPRGRPEVWADNRQALCETLLYYQSYQGACYINKGVLYSFMFDSNGHSRDLLDSDVVIARAGGGMIKDKSTSEMVQAKDIKDNNQSHAVRLAITQQNPMVILCGSENTDAPSRMPHRYCALGWFKATHAWSERSVSKNGKTLQNIKYRFEKLDTSKTNVSWWEPEDCRPAIRVGDLEPPVPQTCQVCRQTHQQVYLEGWMCLSSACPRFWTLPTGVAPEDALLNYDPRFLKQKTEWKSEIAPNDLRPALPQPALQAGDDVAYAMTRGLCCPRCGKCTNRYLWKGWICSNPRCGFVHEPRHILITARSIRDPWHPVSTGFALSRDWADSGFVKTYVEFTHNYRVVHYKVTGVQGRITHMIANKTINEEPRGPDEMFEALQVLDAGLERRRFAAGKEGYMTAFSCNVGMPYKFVASGDTRSFEDSPWPMPNTRTRLNWAAKKIVGHQFTSEFNELLTFGYFDGQNIKYHDDGEKGLGDAVATLSLGNPADMSFRIKTKHFTGVSTSGVFTDTLPIPGTNQFEARKNAFEALQAGSMAMTSGDRRNKLIQMAHELGLKDTAKDRKPLIRLRLSHGDIVIMHGQAIQEYLEHQVDPLGSLRFALTCRTILADHLKPEEMPTHEVKPDEGFYDGSAIAQMRM